MKSENTTLTVDTREEYLYEDLINQLGEEHSDEIEILKNINERLADRLKEKGWSREVVQEDIRRLGELLSSVFSKNNDDSNKGASESTSEEERFSKEDLKKIAKVLEIELSSVSQANNDGTIIVAMERLLDKIQRIEKI